MKNKIKELVQKSIEVKEKIIAQCMNDIENIARSIISACRDNKKVVAFGNGGSAADAQHFVAELVGRFEKERKGLNAIAFTTNSSILTSISNDYGFERVFSRQVEAIVNKGDVVIGISTSGNANNVLEAIKQAKKQGALTIGFTGQNGGKLKPLVDFCFCAPSSVTARIQEVHILLIHIISSLVEEELFKK